MPEISLNEPNLLALGWFLFTIVGYQIVSRSRLLEPKSISAAVQRQRERWMLNMAVRDTRIVDAQLLASLSQGNAFFASTSAIIIGGLSALMGSGDKVQALLERLPYLSKSSSTLFELKIILLISIFIFAFFKFAWGFRLTHYASIMIGATPILSDANRDACEAHALRTARLIGIAAEHANGGLRSFYYAIAGMAWLFHPLAFVIASTWVTLILIRRDYFSRSRRLLMDA